MVKMKNGLFYEIKMNDFANNIKTKANNPFLVNNVGVIAPYPLLVSEMTGTQIWDHINVNVAPTTVMTRLLMTSMQQRGRGVIVNVSSMAAIAPLPYFTVYAATKVYLIYSCCI